MNKKVCVPPPQTPPNDNQRRLAQARQHWQDRPWGSAGPHAGTQAQGRTSGPRLPL